MASKPRYPPHGPFHAALQERVAAYFARSGVVSNQAPRRALKTAVFFGWLVTSYLSLLLVASSAWTALPLCISLGFAMAGIGFSVQHDGGHGGYSRRRWVNQLSALSLDVIGGSSYVWAWKHNVFHHSHTNFVGTDADIDIRPFARLAPEQKRRAGHRFQHLYIWVLYALLTVKWHFVDDFRDVALGKVGTQPFPRPKGWKLATFILGKLLFYGWALVLPLVLHPFWNVFACCAVVSVTVSLVLAITFQMAHATEGAHFPALDETGRAEREWAVEQVRSSFNFAPENRLLGWYVGGLNFQIEHHLFPRVAHFHLPALAKVVRQTCLEFNVPYGEHATFRSAFASHARWVREMGAAPDNDQQGSTMRVQ
ncbi:MAG: fatty acid desaturase family protein [Myxococcaceae bacterium]